MTNLMLWKLPASSLVLSMIFLITACGGGSEANGTANSAETSNGPAVESNAGPESPGSPASSESGNTEAAANNVETTETGDELRTGRISFAKGASSASVRGSVKGYNVVDYIVNAQKGQTMSVSLKSSSSFAYFNVRGSKNGFASELDVNPKAMEETNWKASLPKSGDYYIRVYLVRAEARRDGKADYSLTVSVTGGGANSEPVSDKAVFYDCPDWVQVVATLRAGGKRVEVEIGDTVLRLNRVESGSGAKYADAGEKNVFWLKGNMALIEYRGESHSCKQE